jgi:hypothetical protein
MLSSCKRVVQHCIQQPTFDMGNTDVGNRVQEAECNREKRDLL